MTQEEALLRAVLAAPHDDAPRLIYADWLDEHGQPERAEFVRAQCELARCGRPVETFTAVGREGRALVYDPGDDYESLRRRERELWKLPAAGTWFGDLCYISIGRSLFEQGGDGRKPSALVRRGFIDEIRLPLAAFVGGPCGRCQGLGGRYGDRAMDAANRTLCHNCKATGRVGGLAGRLFAGHPVTRVVPTDREPYFWNGRAFWGRSTWATTDALPDEIYSLLPDHRLSSNRESMKGFPDCEAAYAALSAACVAYGRAEANQLREVESANVDR